MPRCIGVCVGVSPPYPPHSRFARVCGMFVGTPQGEFDALKKLASKNGKDAKAKPDEDIMQFSVAKLSG